MSIAYPEAMPRTPFANWFYLFRFSQGFTQREFAERLRTSQNTVQRWEAGARVPSGPTLVLLEEWARRIGFELPPEVDLRRGPRERSDDE